MTHRLASLVQGSMVWLFQGWSDVLLTSVYVTPVSKPGLRCLSLRDVVPAVLYGVTLVYAPTQQGATGGVERECGDEHSAAGDAGESCPSCIRHAMANGSLGQTWQGTGGDGPVQGRQIKSTGSWEGGQVVCV